MRLIDADALHEALKTKQMWVVRCGDKHNEGYTYDQVHFAIDEAPTIGRALDFVDELIYYIFHVQDADDDNLSAELVCRKLLKHGLIDKVDGCYEPKTEPTISKMEQVDKDINVRSKDERSRR